MTPSGDWDAEAVINIPIKHVDNWIMPAMGGGITDILISMDDKYLYFSNWVHGDVRQYDVTDTRNQGYLIGMKNNPVCVFLWYSNWLKRNLDHQAKRKVGSVV